MTIALVSPYDFGYPGGVTEHVAHLAEQFRRRGHQVHIIVPSSGDDREPHVSADSPVHRIGRVVAIPGNGSVARITLSLRAYLQTKALLQEHHFDVIHLHEPMMPALPLTILRHSKTTNIGTFHAFRNRPLTYFYSKPILRPFFRKLHGRIAVSRPAREFVAEYWPSDYRLIPNGIEFARFNAPRAALSQVSDGRPTVLFVGRLEKRKGLRYLLRAWPQVLREVPDARLVVVGQGRPLVGYRRFALKQGWSENDVLFAGYVSADDLPAYHHGSTLFCAPNTGSESFGIVLLEAMAAGLPIVASEIEGFQEVLTSGKEGLLIPPSNPDRLAQAIAYLLRDPKRRAEMAAEGVRTASNYDWPLVAERVLGYYGEILERRAREPVKHAIRFERVRRVAAMLASRS